MSTWSKFPLIYEINTRVWLRELSSKLGQNITLADVPESEFQRWRDCNFDAVWLMGVWQTGEKGREIATGHAGLQQDYYRTLPDWTPADVGSSPYAVTDYAVSMEFGGERAFKKFKAKLAAHDIKLVLDFVGNHTALDHSWASSHRNYYVQIPNEKITSVDSNAYFITQDGVALACGRDPYYPAWTDSLQLNYGHPDLQTALQNVLLYIASLCDAVRCDMAMLVIKDIFNQTWSGLAPEMTEEFWQKTIAAVKVTYPDFLFIAEAYWDTEAYLQSQGFDFTYDKRLYDRLHHADLIGVRHHLLADAGFQHKLVRFTENHDELRAAMQFGVRNKAASLLALTVPGMRLVHQGQIEGWRLKVPVQLLRRPQEPTDLDTVHFYSELFRVIRNTAITMGEVHLIDLKGPENVIGFERTAGHHGRTVTLVNLSEHDSEVYFFSDAFANVLSYEHLEVVSTERHRSPQFDLWPGGITVRLRANEGLLFIAQ